MCEDNKHLSLLLWIVLILAITLVYVAGNVEGYKFGLRDGAMDQLRGRYEVNYRVEEDGTVLDTIIEIR